MCEVGEHGEFLIRDKYKCPSAFMRVSFVVLSQNLGELLDALICVAEALVALASIGIMHRDIRWANVFHAFSPSSPSPSSDHHYDQRPFSREWVLFDFEYAARVPQPAFAAHTLTPGNHAPEMVHVDNYQQNNNGASNTATIDYTERPHGTAVDIWGLGYLMQNAQVDIPTSHAADLQQLQMDCLQRNPEERPTAEECLQRLRALQKQPQSTEKDIEWLA